MRAALPGACSNPRQRKNHGWLVSNWKTFHYCNIQYNMQYTYTYINPPTPADGRGSASEKRLLTISSDRSLLQEQKATGKRQKASTWSVLQGHGGKALRGTRFPRVAATLESLEPPGGAPRPSFRAWVRLRGKRFMPNLTAAFEARFFSVQKPMLGTGASRRAPGPSFGGMGVRLCDARVFRAWQTHLKLMSSPFRKRR